MVIVTFQPAQKVDIFKKILPSLAQNMKMKLGDLFSFLTQQESLIANKPNGAPVQEQLVLLGTDHSHHLCTVCCAQAMPNSLCPAFCLQKAVYFSS